MLWDNKLPHVTEDIRNCCLNHGFSGVDFYWIRDIGRYNATQFFGLIIENIVPEFACDRYLSYCDSKDKDYKNYDHSVDSPLYQKYQALRGKLPKLSKMFYDLGINLPIQLPKNKMPETDFAYINFYRGNYTTHYALIKKRAADILLSEKVIRKEYLTPVILYDIEPEGYHIQTSETILYPSEKVIKKLESDQVYAVEIEKEELLTDIYTGIVIAKCVDGDTVITCNDGSVKRISHETMDVCERWATVAQFFFESLADA